MDVESSLIRIEHRQIGLISRHQAVAAGLTAAGIHTRLSRGDWRRVRRGVYAVAGVRPTMAQADLAVCLAVGDECRVSHRSAAALWGLQVPRPECIEVVTPPARRTVCLASSSIAQPSSLSPT
jgi:predicted transcriptional regulator of viral defense system